jgi:hypothetical protein
MAGLVQRPKDRLHTACKQVRLLNLHANFKPGILHIPASASPQLLGKGQYGSIYAAVDKRSQETFAAKIIRKSTLTDPKLIQSVRHELQMLYHLKG